MRTPLGTFQQVSLCARCEGTGQTFTPCPKCQGDGRVRETKRISLKVPAGVDAGSRLRVRGEGNSGRRGGEPGDLYVNITIKDHPDLRRDGVTIHSDVEISYVDAILGTQVSHRESYLFIGGEPEDRWHMNLGESHVVWYNAWHPYCYAGAYLS